MIAAEGRLLRRAIGAWVAVLCLGVAGTASAQARTFTTVGTLPILAGTLELQDGLAYVATGTTFSVFDQSNAAAPKKLGSRIIPKEIWSFRVQGKTAYVGVNFLGLGILNVSNPSTLVLRGSFRTPGQAKVGVVFGTRALVVDHMEGIVHVDITNPSKIP